MVSHIRIRGDVVIAMCAKVPMSPRPVHTTWLKAFVLVRIQFLTISKWSAPYPHPLGKNPNNPNLLYLCGIKVSHLRIRGGVVIVLCAKLAMPSRPIHAALLKALVCVQFLLLLKLFRAKLFC